MIEIRRAEASDIAWILSQLKEFSRFIETRYQLYGSDEYSRKGIELLINEHVFFVAEKNSLPIGFIAGYFTPHLFNPEIKILNELFWWTQKGHHRAAFLLLQEYLRFGKSNAQWITLSLNRFTPINEKSILKRGFHEHERTYLLEN